MLFEQKTVKLKNGTSCVLRSPVPEDAAEMIANLKTCAAQTHFILRTPEECTETPEQEAAYLTNINQSAYDMMIVCIVDGKIAGNSQLNLKRRKKFSHRASVGIALERAYWNLGIGTALFEEMIAVAKAHGVMQLELEFIEGNARGRALYEKMGFRTVSIRPDNVRLEDGTLLHEYFMVKDL